MRQIDASRGEHSAPCTSMGPRPSISGELPIHSYFNSTGANWNKDKGSTKRRTGADAADEANRTRPKRQRTGQPSKGTNLEAQEKSRSGSAEARTKAVVETTSIPTPISVAKLSRSTSSQAPADMEVITVTSSSPPRATFLEPEDAVRTARNTASGSSLPTPQTVSRGAKKNPRTDAAVPTPMPTVSRSVINSGPTIPSFLPRPPLTPSRPRSKPLVHRTTPQSQRIVPSSQWSDDEQSNTASSLEANRDIFLLHRTEEYDSCPDELSLPPPSDVPSRSFSTSSLAPVKFRVPACPTFIELAGGQGCSRENSLDTGNAENTRRPLSLSGSSRFSLPSSNGLGPQDRGQCSQIEPTSQIDEIELKFLSQRLFVDPILSAQVNHCEVVPSVERSQPGRLQDWSLHSEAVVEQESSSTTSCREPSPPPSPLTPLSSSSPLLSNAMHRNIDTREANRSPSQQALHKAPESPAPRSSSELMVDLGMGGTAQPLPEAEIPMEDPTPREDGNTSIHPTPVRRRPLPDNVQSTISPAGDSPSPGHSRISHAKLRSLPDPTIELDSEGEEMSPASSFSIPATSQEMSLSFSASSCLDIVGTLPSEVGDFLEMVDSYAFSQT